VSLYEVAFLLRMPVCELRRLPYDELLGWHAYFERRPPGWREDDRTVKLMHAQGVKEKGENIFPSLRAVYHPHKEKVDSEMLDTGSFKGSLLFQKIMRARGGDSLGLQ
jgi:hypothetical protein